MARLHTTLIDFYEEIHKGDYYDMVHYLKIEPLQIT